MVFGQDARQTRTSPLRPKTPLSMFLLRTPKGAPVSGRRIRRDNCIVSIKSNHPGDFCEGITERNRLVRLYIRSEPEVEGTMKHLVRTILLAWAICLSPTVAEDAKATKPMPPINFKVKVEPVGGYVGLGPRVMRLSLAATVYDSTTGNCPLCGNQNVTITYRGRSSYLGPTDLVVDLRPGVAFQQDLTMVFVPNDTINMIFEVWSMIGTAIQLSREYADFTTTEDSIISWRGDPREYHPYPTMPEPGPAVGNLRPGEFPADDSLWGIIQLSEETFPKAAGPAKLKLRFAPAKHPCDSLKFSVMGINGLKIAGDHVWTAPMVGTAPYEHDFDIVVPPNDTSGIRVEMRCGGAHHELEQYFAANEHGVTCFAWDQVGLRWRPQQKLLTPIQELRLMYPTPLTDDREQVISFRHKSYHRYRGEIEFVEMPQYRGTAQEMHQHLLDSINAIPLTATFDIVLSIRDSMELNKARTLVPDCRYSGQRDSCSLYKCRATKATIYQLVEMGLHLDYEASMLHPVRQDTATTIDIPVIDTSKTHVRPVGTPKVR
jgi:hypothetical protein